MTTSSVGQLGLSGSTDNITLRRAVKHQTSKMAATSPIIAHDLGTGGANESLFVDSILSQNEAEDVERMLVLEGEISKGTSLDFDIQRGGFLTSTQMVRGGTYRKSSLIMSPIMDHYGSLWGTYTDLLLVT